MSKNVKIYVADPDPDVVRFMRGTLTPAGHTVQESLDFGLVVDEMQVFTPDIAFLSATTSEYDYLEMLGRLKDDERCASIPVVVLVDRSDEDSPRIQRTPGVTDVMFKPVMANELLARVKSLTGEPFDGTTDVNLGETGPIIAHSIPLSDLKTGSERYDRDLATFIELTEAISSSLDPEDTFYVLVRRTADAIPCDRCNVVLGGVGETEAFVVASHDNPNLRRHTIDLARYPEYNLALESLEPVLIDDAQLHPVTEKVRKEVALVQLGSTLVFPLIVREQAVGVLSLSTRGTSREFTAAEVLLLRAMANLAACVVKATTALESLRYHSVAQKAPAEEFENIVLDLDDQIEMLIDEFEGKE